MQKKKVNPRRRPATLAEAQDFAITATWAIFYTVMRDKEGYGYKRLRRVWDEVNYLSDSIAKGYVNIKDLIGELEEGGIRLA